MSLLRSSTAATSQNLTTGYGVQNRDVKEPILEARSSNLRLNPETILRFGSLQALTDVSWRGA